MASYSKSEKALHKLYLSNYFISKATFELETILHGSRADQIRIKQHVFVSGLARSGTTALMRALFATGQYASLQYSNMPIILAPNMWNKKLKLEAHERAHGDGIIIDGNSPEEFDEYFWKSFLKDSYIGPKGLERHEVDPEILEKYERYVRLICLAKGKDRYLSKNNNNILRFSSLEKLDGSHIVLMFRHPITHASSLLKLHKSFSKSQEEDPFVLDYFNYLGHHEFGLNHKPFLLADNFLGKSEAHSRDSLDYWLLNWINYYEYVKERLTSKVHLICFEDYIADNASVYDKLESILDIEISRTAGRKHQPTQYKEPVCDAKLKERAISIYEALKRSKI